MEALQANDDHWNSLTIPRDQLDLFLQQVMRETNPTSHHAVTTWKATVRNTAMLITAIDTYLVWLDLAGWVPASIPLQNRLQHRYSMLVQMLSAEVFSEDVNEEPASPKNVGMIVDGGDGDKVHSRSPSVDECWEPAQAEFWEY